MLETSRADFDDPALLVFLRAHLEDIAPTGPAESQHALDVAGLQEPGMRVWVAHLDAALVGTIALGLVEPGHEELKSMRTAPAHRGEGIGSELLRVALEDAEARGIRRVSLETGSMAFFAPARALYRRSGFTDAGPFGTYVPDPNSTFMTRSVG